MSLSQGHLVKEWWMSLVIAGLNEYWGGSWYPEGAIIRVSLSPNKTQEETSSRCLLARDI